jgi:protein transport protein SEC24
VPAFIFIIDVSYNNVKSGMVKLFCEQITDIIQNHMPVDEANPNGENIRMRVGFITYDSTVHFYNIKVTERDCCINYSSFFGTMPK